MKRRDPSRRSLPLAEWPAADQAAWKSLLEPGDILDNCGAGAHWAPGTRTGILQSYGQWLAWLTREHPDALRQPAAERVTPATIAGYVRHLKATVAGSTAALRILHLAGVIGPLAPDQDWRWLRRVARRLKRKAKPVRIKKDRLLSVEEICARGIALMATASGRMGPEWRRAEQFRDGLMLALLASRPVRISNFSAVEVGRHLCRSGDGYVLRFEAAETKGRAELDFPVPDELVPFIQAYLDVYRPILKARAAAPASTNRLWISRNGTPMDNPTLYCRVKAVTRREFGIALNPHLFRDCAATSIALEDPEHVRITRLILGHSTLRTSERHYNHADAVQAARRHQKHVLELRQQLVISTSGGIDAGPEAERLASDAIDHSAPL